MTSTPAPRLIHRAAIAAVSLAACAALATHSAHAGTPEPQAATESLPAKSCTPFKETTTPGLSARVCTTVTADELRVVVRARNTTSTAQTGHITTKVKDESGTVGAAGPFKVPAKRTRVVMDLTTGSRPGKLIVRAALFQSGKIGVVRTVVRS